jgi:hypothetical protein
MLLPGVTIVRHLRKVTGNLGMLFFLVLLPLSTWAASHDPILVQIKPNTITIIGESHKKAESIELFKTLVLDTIKKYQCAIVGLEIGSDQQTIIDAVMQGRESVNEIALWPPLDHPPYRSMIETFVELKQQVQCIKVIAIDSGMDNDVDRDQWMAVRLAEQGRVAPILVLLGAFIVWFLLVKGNTSVLLLKHGGGQPGLANGILLSLDGAFPRFRCNRQTVGFGAKLIGRFFNLGSLDLGYARFVGFIAPFNVANNAWLGLFNNTPANAGCGFCIDALFA